MMNNIHHLRRSMMWPGCGEGLVQWHTRFYSKGTRSLRQGQVAADKRKEERVLPSNCPRLPLGACFENLYASSHVCHTVLSKFPICNVLFFLKKFSDVLVKWHWGRWNFKRKTIEVKGKQYMPITMEKCFYDYIHWGSELSGVQDKERNFLFHITREILPIL